MISSMASRRYFGLLSAFLLIFLCFALFSQVGTDMTSSSILIQSFREKGILSLWPNIFYFLSFPSRFQAGGWGAQPWYCKDDRRTGHVQILLAHCISSPGSMQVAEGAQWIRPLFDWSQNWNQNINHLRLCKIWYMNLAKWPKNSHSPSKSPLNKKAYLHWKWPN